jgi:hypothetical protein
MSFLLWRAETKSGHCVLSPTEIEDVDLLHEGAIVPPDFGQPIEYRMSDDFPDDIKLSDNYVVAGQVLVSGKLKHALEAILPHDRSQYLPVKIINHKGRVAATDYSILHPHYLCDCIDLQASQVKWNPLNKSKILSCKSLIIKQDAIGDSVQILRLKYWGARLLIRDSAAKNLKDAGFVGLHFIEPSKYSGVG